MRVGLNQNRRRRKEAGITLIEAVVALAIFGISFVSLYGGMSMGFAVIGDARENLRATQVMVEKMETIRLYSWDQLNTPGFIPTTFTESYYPDGNNDQNNGSTLAYSGTLSIGNGPGGVAYSGEMRRVTVTVSWTSRGRTHNRSMSTYVSHHGLQNYIY